MGEWTRKHAVAGNVAVRLDYGADQVVVEVSDDGRGFDAATIPDGGFGLAGMHARITQVSGTLEVDSAPGQGTRVTVEVPWAQAPAAAPDVTPPARP